MQLSDLTYQLAGFTVVHDFSLRVAPETGSYSLRLVLADGTADGSRRVGATFDKVAQLTLRGFGGGWTQFLYLGIEDRAATQNENTKYWVRDLENDVISFACRSIEIESLR